MQEGMSLKYIYNNVTKYKDIDKHTGKDVEVDVICKKKSDGQRAKIIK